MLSAGAHQSANTSSGVRQQVRLFFGQSMKIKNWSKFQHFKDRRPPWVKLYRDLLDDMEWHLLDPAASKVLVSLWLIASEDENQEGTLPDIKTLSWRLRMSESELTSQINKLSHWLDHVDIKPISHQYQDDMPEKRREEKETEAEIETKTDKEPRKRVELFVLPDWIDKDHWDAWHSTPKRRKATVQQKELAVKKLKAWKDEGFDYAGALENAATGGYQGLFLPSSGPAKTKVFHDISRMDYTKGVNDDGRF